MNNYWKVILTLIVLVLGLSAWIIWGNPNPGTGIDNEQPLRDSLALVEKQRAELLERVDSLYRSYDSLLTIKQQVRIEYYEKIKFVHTADPNQLDSIIRAAIR